MDQSSKDNKGKEEKGHKRVYGLGGNHGHYIKRALPLSEGGGTLGKEGSTTEFSRTILTH